MAAVARFSSVALLALGMTLACARAQATETAACVTASEKGQRARSAGKLREARDQFVACGGEGCPLLIRRDCAEWQAQLATMVPSVVFGAKDQKGRDLFDVAVTMDSEPLVTKLDGNAVVVDPGPHTFVFETQGQAPITERALVKEGEKARVISVGFPHDSARPREPPLQNDNVIDRVKPPTERGHTALPWVVVGVGAATVITGGIMFLAAPKRPSNCDGASQRCAPAPNESAADLTDDREKAARSDDQHNLGLVAGGAGLVIVAGGLLWHFLEPTGPAKQSLRLSPWAGPRSSGVVLDATF